MIYFLTTLVLGLALSLLFHLDLLAFIFGVAVALVAVIVGALDAIRGKIVIQDEDAK